MSDGGRRVGLLDRDQVFNQLAIVLTVAGGAFAVAFAIAAASADLLRPTRVLGGDTATAYLLPEGSPDAMLYAPPVMLLFSLFGAIPWPVFATAWSVMIAICITFMAGPFTLPVTLTNPIASEITLGNIHALTGVVVIAGFRKPALWAFVLLTKVTPGVGLLWFPFRRRWRRLAIALGATAIIVLPTVILTPELWVRWFNALSAGQSGEFAAASSSCRSGRGCRPRSCCCGSGRRGFGPGWCRSR